MSDLFSAEFITQLKIFVPRIVFALLIYVLGRIITRYIVKFTIEIMRHNGVDEGLFRLTKTVINIALTIVILLTCAKTLGIDITPVLTALSAILLAMALAIKDSLSNLTSGIFIIASKPFVHDDFVEMCGISGTVKEIGLLHTIVMSPDNKKIMVPNADICKSAITNYSTQEFRRLDLTFPIAYSQDWHKARDIILKAASEHDKLKPDTEPSVIILDFGEKTVNLTCRMWVYSDTFGNSRFTLNEQIRTLLDDAGLSDPYKQELLLSVDAQKKLSESNI